MKVLKRWLLRCIYPYIMLGYLHWQWANRMAVFQYQLISTALQWRHNECDGVSNHQLHDCLLNRLFRRRSNKTSKLRATGLCAGNSPVTGEFPEQRASNAEHGYIDDVIMAKLPGRIWVGEISGCKRYGGQSKFHIRYSKHFMKRGN